MSRLKKERWNFHVYRPICFKFTPQPNFTLLRSWWKYWPNRLKNIEFSVPSFFPMRSIITVYVMLMKKRLNWWRSSWSTFLLCSKWSLRFWDSWPSKSKLLSFWPVSSILTWRDGLTQNVDKKSWTHGKSRFMTAELTRNNKTVSTSQFAYDLLALYKKHWMKSMMAKTALAKKNPRLASG